MQEKDRYTYEDFLKIIQILRSENGCPWDREQTHQSLRPCMMEEAAEVLAGIRILEQTGDYENLREELGDVLLQVVMHSQIAKEEGLFTMEDVVNEVATKMIRRHPHVFGDTSADTSNQALQKWEEIKKQEKEGKTMVLSPLREIPIELPALTRAQKVLKKVDKLYQPQRDYASSVAQLKQLVADLEARNPEEDSSKIEESVASLLMEISNVSRVCKLSQEQILNDCIDNLIESYE